ncbi:hypothetical protein LguiB_026531 [Lonicera macranthoides]
MGPILLYKKKTYQNYSSSPALAPDLKREGSTVSHLVSTLGFSALINCRTTRASPLLSVILASSSGVISISEGTSKSSSSSGLCKANSLHL